MCAGSSTIRLKGEHQVGSPGGQKELKGHDAGVIPCSRLSPAAIIFVWQDCLNLLTSGNGRDQTSKLEGIKHQLTQKAFEAGPTAAGLPRLSGFPVGYRGRLRRDGGGRMSALTRELNLFFFWLLSAQIKCYGL